jgi:serine/threonine-protein kinase
MPIELHPEFRFNYGFIDHAEDRSIGEGRSRLADSIASRLHLSNGGAFLITGYRGVGKTTFVRHVLHRVGVHIEQTRPSGTDARPLMLDVYLNIARPLSGVELMHLILRQMHNRLSELGLLRRLPRHLRTDLRLAFLRTSAMLSTGVTQQAEAQIGFDQWLSLTSKVSSGTSREISYLAYDERSAESDLIGIARRLIDGFRPVGPFGVAWPWRRTIRIKLVLVFDELDKIDEEVEDKSALTEILQTLKTLFTTSGISFLFVAGRSMHEHWLRDVERGDSIFESVFGELHYLPAVWDEIDEICDPLLKGPDELGDYDSELYQDFKRYLAFTGRGIPRRILRGFYERVRWDDHQLRLELSKQDRRQMRFHAQLYALLQEQEQRILGDPSRDLRRDRRDRQRLSLYYLVDWVLANGSVAFNLKDVINAASNLLSAGIAATPQRAPSIAAGMVEVLLEHQYLEQIANTQHPQTVTDEPEPEQDQEQSHYRLLERRLIEMGRYHEEYHEDDAAEAFQTLSNRYGLLDLIGVGVSARVYRAYDQIGGRFVAIKRFNPEYFSADSTLVERLLAEARVQQALEHRGIVQLLDVVLKDQKPYLVMEHLTGATLADMLASDGAMTVERTLTIARPLLEAIGYLHDHGVLWRDLKPSNIMVTLESRIVAMDFGTSQILNDAIAAPDTTRVGLAIGTPAYMSPEQIRAEPPMPQADLFSFGVVLFEMLTGAPPWPVSNAVELLAAIRDAPAHTLPGLLQIDEPLRAVLAKLLDEDPRARYPSAESVLRALPVTADDPDLSAAARRSSESRSSGAGDLSSHTNFVDDMTRVPPARKPWEDAPDLRAQASPSADEHSFGPPPLIPDGSTPEPEPEPPVPDDLLALDAESMPVLSAPFAAAAPSHTQAGHPALYLREGTVERRYDLIDDPITIGRDKASDLQLNDPAASRNHARIEREGDAYVIEDLNSANGVAINGRPVYKQHRLADRDVIAIGGTEMVFRSKNN